jgi:hypothetical protein
MLLEGIRIHTLLEGIHIRGKITDGRRNTTTGIGIVGKTKMGNFNTTSCMLAEFGWNHRWLTQRDFTVLQFPFAGNFMMLKVARL